MSGKTSLPPLLWHRKQAGAYSHRVNGTSYEDALKEGKRPVGHVFLAQDIKNAGANKRYAVVPYQKLLKYFLAQDLSNFYELITPGPSRLYFDLDGKLDKDGKLAGQKLEELRGAYGPLMAACNLHAQRLGLGVQFEFVVLDASAEGYKFSMHIVARALNENGEEVFFLSNAEAGAFVRTLLVLTDLVPEWIAMIVDLSVYTKNRLFRFIYAKKNADDAVALTQLVPEGTDLSPDFFSKTLVVPPYMPENPLPPIQVKDLLCCGGGEAKSTSMELPALRQQEEIAKARGGVPTVSMDIVPAPSQPRELAFSFDPSMWPGQAVALSSTFYRGTYSFPPLPPDIFTLIDHPENFQSLQLPHVESSFLCPTDLEPFSRMTFNSKTMPPMQAQMHALIAKRTPQLLKRHDLGETAKRVVRCAGFLVPDLAAVSTVGDLCVDFVNKITQDTRARILPSARGEGCIKVVTRSHNCGIKGDAHLSNHVYFVFHLATATVLQKCTDDVCNGKAPLRIELPVQLTLALAYLNELVKLLDYV